MTEIRLRALNLLARREHSCFELRRKLVAKGFAADSVLSVVDALVSENLQSDARFVESYVRARAARGYGPVRIRAELLERKVAESLIDSYLNETENHWCELAKAVKVKKFGANGCVLPVERAKQTGFLFYRGFTGEQIKEAMEG